MEQFPLCMNGCSVGGVVGVVFNIYVVFNIEIRYSTQILFSHSTQYLLHQNRNSEKDYIC